jgi:hypothetical protein
MVEAPGRRKSENVVRRGKAQHDDIVVGDQSHLLNTFPPITLQFVKFIKKPTVNEAISTS